MNDEFHKLLRKHLKTLGDLGLGTKLPPASEIRITNVSDPTEMMKASFCSGTHAIAEMLKNSQLNTIVKTGIRDDCTWTFPVAHENAICLEEIASTLTRERPFLYTQAVGSQKHNTALFVFVHDSILQKAISISADESPKIVKRLSGGHGVAQLNKAAEISTWLQWVKDVKAAKWPKDYDRLTVQVFSPEI